ncbi:MAG: PIG-L deacetylase family protein [Microthrixaceae bacterium]
MIEVPVLEGRDRAPVVLCLGAHGDDIEIGCGGTVLRLVEGFPTAQFHWVVFSGDERRRGEATASAEAFLSGGDRTQVEVHGFRESYFPHDWAPIKDTFEELATAVRPDLILTHCLEDRHQDHRTVSELTHNTFRNHLILEYEIPKYDGDLAPVGVFVPLSQAHMDRKADLLMEHFGSQRSRSWFDRRTFEGLARLRGVECNSSGGFAEGFRSRKVTLGISGSEC